MPSSNLKIAGNLILLASLSCSSPDQKNIRQSNRLLYSNVVLYYVDLIVFNQRGFE